MEKPGYVSLFGFQFLDFESEYETASYITSHWGEEKKLPLICTPNAFQIVEFEDQPELKAFFKQSEFILADGQPLVWLSRLKKTPLKTRLTGSGIFPILWKLLIEKNEKILLIVPKDGISEKMQQEYPACIIEKAPYFNCTEEIETWSYYIESKIIDYNIRYVFLGLGFPKQEWLTYFYFKRNPNAKVLFSLFGASFEFYCGLKKRAPKAWSRLHLEWLFRFFQEPRRLWKRYTIGNFNFLRIFLKEWMN